MPPPYANVAPFRRGGGVALPPDAREDPVIVRSVPVPPIAEVRLLAVLLGVLGALLSLPSSIGCPSIASKSRSFFLDLFELPMFDGNDFIAPAIRARPLPLARFSLSSCFCEVIVFRNSIRSFA